MAEDKKEFSSYMLRQFEKINSKLTEISVYIATIDTNLKTLSDSFSDSEKIILDHEKRIGKMENATVILKWISGVVGIVVGAIVIKWVTG